MKNRTLSSEQILGIIEGKLIDCILGKSQYGTPSWQVHKAMDKIDKEACLAFIDGNYPDVGSFSEVTNLANRLNKGVPYLCNSH